MEKVNSIKQILEKVTKTNKMAKMVISGANNESILEFCLKTKDLKITDSILVGDKNSILEISSKKNINISDLEIIDIKDEDEIAKYSSKLIHEGKADILAKG